MNIQGNLKGRRCWPAIGALAFVISLSGCLEERLVWSPDGSRAAVITTDGLYFCDAGGRLSPLAMPQVKGAAWLGSGHGLVLSRAHELGNWPAVAAVLGPQRAAAVEAETETAWRRLVRGTAWKALTSELKGDKEVMLLCLRDHHAADLRSRLGAGEWGDLAKVTVTTTELERTRLDGDRLDATTRLYEGIGDIRAIRISPDDRAVAFTAPLWPDKDELQLLVAPIDGAVPAVPVADHVSAYPDWTPDSRSVAYFGSAGPGPADDAVRLGALTRREVVDAAGRIKVAENPDYLAGVLFNGFGRVRCLRDGRILFNAAELNLPFAAADYGDTREQWFALDPDRAPTLTRLIPRKSEVSLPQQLAFFEVSPDEKQAVFGSMQGEVCLLTLATGEVERLQGANKDSPQGAPVWRKAGELCFVKRIEPKPASGCPWEVVLRRGQQETVLSAGWPAEVLQHLGQ